MATKKQKYYVVWKGVETGIFNTWAKCQSQIAGYPAAQYKSFRTKAEAEDAFKGNYKDFIERKSKPKSKTFFDENKIIKNSISVDAACSGNPGLLEYRGVYTYSVKEIFHIGPLKNGTNNIGEFLALVHCLALCKKSDQTTISIYSDSKIAMGWVRKKKANTKLKQTAENKTIFELIQRAEQWLAQNPIENPILKWETKSWGEIPADFGRK